MHALDTRKFYNRNVVKRPPKRR